MEWSPSGGSSTQEAIVEYRPQGTNQWHRGYSLWFDPIAKQYRGSLVHLQPATTYDIRLQLTGTQTQAMIQTTTWSENFPIAKTVYLPTGELTQPIQILESGTPDGYILYTHPPGQSSIIQAANLHQFNIMVGNYNQALDPSKGVHHVIIRGMTLKGAQQDAIKIFEMSHDIVIEDNDISNWGRKDSVAGSNFGMERDAAIYLRSNTQRIIIQRNQIHHPRYDSNSWAEFRKNLCPNDNPLFAPRTCFHPNGPQGVSTDKSLGNHVIRYNRIYSDDDHYFNDIFNGGANASTEGFPVRDTDIYGNYLERAWDNPIEAEGGNRNVRIWGNYIARSYQAIAIAPTSVGPVYIWRNIIAFCTADSQGNPNGGFLKTGNSTSLPKGRIYVFHNTVLRSHPSGATPCRTGLGSGGEMNNVISRNNIIDVSTTAFNDRGNDPTNDFDFDLYQGSLSSTRTHQQHGIAQRPTYSPTNNFLTTFYLFPNSPGQDAGTVLPNFNDGFVGAAPDMGAHETGTPALAFGLQGTENWAPTPTPTPIPVPTNSPTPPPLAQNQCSPDLNGDGIISVPDLLLLLSKWGQKTP